MHVIDPAPLECRSSSAHGRRSASRTSRRIWRKSRRKRGARVERGGGRAQGEAAVRQPLATPRARRRRSRRDVDQRCIKEIVFAARRLVRSPAFTLAAVLTLALAIGANASIFAVVQRVVLNPLPYPDSDRLIELDHGAQRLNLPSGHGNDPRPLLSISRARSHTLDGVALYAVDDLTLTGDGDPERIRVARVTTTLAPVMRVWPALGRWFRRRGRRAWRPTSGRALARACGLRRYGGDPSIVGRSVMLAGVPTEVIGVMPASYAFPDPRVDVWIAEPITRSMGFGIWTYNGVARLRDGVTVADTRAELNGLIGDLPRAFPGDPSAVGNGEAIKLFSSARTLKDMTVGDVARGLWILFASVGAGLAGGVRERREPLPGALRGRQREVAVRLALGAGRLGIARYFFAESALLSTGGRLDRIGSSPGAPCACS